MKKVIRRIGKSISNVDLRAGCSVTIFSVTLTCRSLGPASTVLSK